MSEPGTSVAQEAVGVIDMGAESFSVDKIESVESEKPGSDAPAAEPEVKEGTPPSDEPIVEDGGQDADDGEDDDLPVPDADPPGVEKRIGKLTKKFRDQERVAAAEAEKRRAAEAEAEALKAENEALKLKSEEAELGDLPQEDQYDTDAEYLEALTDYKVEQRFAKINAERQAEAAEKAETDLAAAASDQVRRVQAALAKGPETYSDFEDVIADLQVPTATLPVLETLDNAADVAYTLGSNPEKARALADMHPSQAGAELQRISMNLKRRKITKAPAPITPISTEGGSAKTLDQMSNAEYRAFRDKQDKARRDRR